MIIGYARVSTDDQRLDMQLTALKEAGCEKIFQDHGATGSNMDRPGLEAVIKALEPGDTLVVWRLDRLGRSLTDLVQFIEELGERGSEFRSLNEAIDTSTSGGRLIFHIMAAFAEFERNLISERTRAGLAAARRRGRRLGRPPKILSDNDLAEARQALQEQGRNIDEIAARYRISSSTLRRRLSVIEPTQSAPPANRSHLTAEGLKPKSFRQAVAKLLSGTFGGAGPLYSPKLRFQIAPEISSRFLNATSGNPQSLAGKTVSQFRFPQRNCRVSFRQKNLLPEAGCRTRQRPRATPCLPELIEEEGTISRIL